MDITRWKYITSVKEVEGQECIKVNSKETEATQGISCEPAEEQQPTSEWAIMWRKKFFIRIE